MKIKKGVGIRYSDLVRARANLIPVLLRSGVPTQSVVLEAARRIIHSFACYDQANRALAELLNTHAKFKV